MNHSQSWNLPMAATAADSVDVAGAIRKQRRARGRRSSGRAVRVITILLAVSAIWGAAHGAQRVNAYLECVENGGNALFRVCEL